MHFFTKKNEKPFVNIEQNSTTLFSLDIQPGLNVLLQDTT